MAGGYQFYEVRIESPVYAKRETLRIWARFGVEARKIVTEERAERGLETEVWGAWPEGYAPSDDYYARN